MLPASVQASLEALYQHKAAREATGVRSDALNDMLDMGPQYTGMEYGQNSDANYMGGGASQLFGMGPLGGRLRKRRRMYLSGGGRLRSCYRRSRRGPSGRLRCIAYRPLGARCSSYRVGPSGRRRCARYGGNLLAGSMGLVGGACRRRRAYTRRNGTRVRSTLVCRRRPARRLRRVSGRLCRRANGRFARC